MDIIFWIARQLLCCFCVIIFIDWILMSLPCLDFSKKQYPKKFLIRHSNRIDFQKKYECSAFSTAFLLRHFDIEADGFEVYSEMPNKMRSGYVYPKGILNYLKTKGFKTMFYKGTIQSLKRQVNKGIPVIAFIKVNLEKNYTHYVPVVGYDEEYIYIAESLNYLANCQESDGVYNRKVPIREFKKLWNIKNIRMPIYSNTYITVKK